jgi:hypothetical protein
LKNRLMIISASRRTDIPAFYTPWFMNRLRSGWCRVPNPFNPLQVSEVSLRPEDVDLIVFWTRSALPLLPHLKELEGRGYRFYFLVTLMDNPRVIDPGCPPLNSALRTFQSLADRIGPDKVIWRYDPIVFSTLTDPGYHRRAFRRIAGQLQGYTGRCIVSIMHPYRKARRRLIEKGIELTPWEENGGGDLMHSLGEEAHDRGIEILSCASPATLERFGINRGKCVDDTYIHKVFGIEVTHGKDPSQRKECGCVASRDIGMYDTCLYGCLYCYGTNSFEKARENYRRHDPAAPSLMASP